MTARYTGLFHSPIGRKKHNDLQLEDRSWGIAQLQNNVSKT